MSAIEVNYAEIDAQLVQWRQGDFTCESVPFVHMAATNAPLSRAAVEAPSSDNNSIIQSECEGLVIVTQSCDVIRNCKERPYLEVSPLVKVSDTNLGQIRRGKMPRYCYIPGAKDKCLVGDLDRTMTVEKSIVSRWKRIAGVENDEEARNLADALSRKRSRFAFPNDFNAFAGKLESLMKEKHGRQSEQGNAIRSIRQIRIKATPSWNASKVSLEFYFIAEEDVPRDSIVKYYDAWMKTIAPSGRYQSIYGTIVFLEDMTALEYNESDPLDLDHLTAHS